MLVKLISFEDKVVNSNLYSVICYNNYMFAMLNPNFNVLG
jgi:hypothetical protein